MSVEKDIQSFKMATWNDSKPLLFAIQYVEELIKENHRMRSVMMAALREIDNNLDSHTSGEESHDLELFRLLDNLCFKRRDGYDSTALIEGLRKKLNFDNFEK